MEWDGMGWNGMDLSRSDENVTQIRRRDITQHRWGCVYFGILPSYILFIYSMRLSVGEAKQTLLSPLSWALP
eukprot:5766889-Pyramimonas_sp.AAC.1